MKNVTPADVKALFDRPLLDLIFEAAQVHRANHDANEIQLCTLLSIKTGGCPEDCGYCSQSVYNNSDVEREKLMTVDAVLESAKAAKEAGSTRFCMGAGWRGATDGRAFDRVIDMVKGVREMGMEACCTLGLLSESQAERLKEAGLTAYNHNLDTSEDYYKKVITTRTYQNRMDTISNVAKAGISLCCGGIIGMGETQEDRITLLHNLANLDPQPESVPINALVPVAGTPIGDKLMGQKLPTFDWIRSIAVARILLPKAMVRLSAGRLEISAEAQALAFLAGANSIFTGDKLLTTPNPEFDIDHQLLGSLGLKGRMANKGDGDQTMPSHATSPAMNSDCAPHQNKPQNTLRVEIK